MSAWSHINCSPVNPVFISVPWQLPAMWTTIIKTVVRIILRPRFGVIILIKRNVWLYRFKRKLHKCGLLLFNFILLLWPASLL